VIVRFTPSSRRQFLRAIEYVRRRNQLAAVRFNLRAAKTLRRLAPHPHSGRRIPELPDLAHREVVVPPYRFFYRTVGKIVWIVAVWHDARLPDKPDGKG
jgi:toxin ParE1/3/4